jgi:Ca2+-transporting ATPase
MGITGTEVSKEAADLVLADDNFATIVDAVERGRAIYDNIATFVRFQVTTNLGAIITITGASLLGLPVPLSAVQVLFINIIADGPPAMTLGVDPPAPDTMQRPPRPPGTAILDLPRATRLLYAASVMAIGTVLVYALARNAWGDVVATTMAFTTFVFANLLNVFNVRSEYASVFHRASLANAKLWLAIGSVTLVQIAAVTLAPLQGLFGTTALTGTQWAICIATATAVVLAEELRKLIARVRARP